MLINGEKFACEACIRGHRVSSCHHQDRPLLHVNKKGRPVSQCQHCRGLRKARSQHVHCECHQKGHSKDECHHDKEDTQHGTCCCQHTGKCTCALKKEQPLEAVPEELPPLLQPKDSHKARHLNMNSHESKATVFSNGHHKPVHKFNDAHNQLGAPYRIPSKANSLHGHREIAQRSVDNLSLTNRSSKPHHESPLHHIMEPPAQTRMVKSEHNSPHLGPVNLPSDDITTDFTIPAFDPNAYSYSPFGSNNSPVPPNQTQMDIPLPERFPESWFMSYEQAHDYEPPAVDWSQYNFDSSENLPGGMKPSGYRASSQPPWFASFDQFGRLNPAVVSSGDVSETEDFSTARPTVPRSTSHDASRDSPIADDASDRYRLSSASSYMGTPQGNMLASENMGTLDIDEYLRQAAAETRKMQSQTQLLPMQSIQAPQQIQQHFGQRSPSQGQRTSDVGSAISSPGRSVVVEHPYTIHEAQQIAHMNDSLKLQLQQGYETTPSSISEDPAWSQAPDMSNPAMSLDDEQEDEDWVR